MKKPKLLWKGNIGGDPNNPFMKHPFVSLSEKGNLTKKQWKVINEFIKKSIEDNKEAIIEGVKKDLETQWFAEKVETPKGKGYKVAKLEGEGYIHIDTVNEIEKKAYQKGWHDGYNECDDEDTDWEEDAVRKFVKTIRLNGCTVANKLNAPKTEISLFVVLDQIEKLMEQYLSQQREKGE